MYIEHNQIWNFFQSVPVEVLVAIVKLWISPHNT